MAGPKAMLMSLDPVAGKPVGGLVGAGAMLATVKLTNGDVVPLAVPVLPAASVNTADAVPFAQTPGAVSGVAPGRLNVMVSPLTQPL